ncbi:hypothetical protein FBY06_10844 [Pseudomonas sp. SJZ085]|nr:hypothetical protein FBX99_1092 [Pseudomonas sp. SJZ074]TWC38734.1 hypothetical protein FBY06_10844 [Pseudomonas sp. SJZ085]
MNKHQTSSPDGGAFPYNDPDPDKLQEAADRALDFHLGTHPDPKPKTSTQVFTVIDTLDTESLLANLSETLASANAMSMIWRSIWKARGGMSHWAWRRWLN